MKQPRPIVRIRRQGLTIPPFINDSTLVDDTVALVDDPTTLVGGPVTTIRGLPANARTPRTYTHLKKRR